MRDWEVAHLIYHCIRDPENFGYDLEDWSVHTKSWRTAFRSSGRLKLLDRLGKLQRVLCYLPYLTYHTHPTDHTSPPSFSIKQPALCKYNSIVKSTKAERFPREVLLGITGKDFTIVAASKAAMRGATILKASDDKTRELNKYTLMAFTGEAGDTGIERENHRDKNTVMTEVFQYNSPNTSKQTYNSTLCEMTPILGLLPLPTLFEESWRGA